MLGLILLVLCRLCGRNNYYLGLELAASWKFEFIKIIVLSLKNDFGCDLILPHGFIYQFPWI